MSTTPTVDRDGFTDAEKAYFASQGQNTEGLLDDAGDAAAAETEPAVAETSAAASAASGVTVAADPNADPFDELEKVAKDNKGKTGGKLIPEQNFRAVSEKYKLTKSERDELRRRTEALEADVKSARDEAQKERELRSRIDERLKLFNEVIAPAAANPANAAPPNPEEDIFGYLKWQAEQQDKRFNELAERVGQTSQTIQSRDAESELRSAYQADATRFARENPDFAAAYNHVNAVRDKMLEEIGYNDPDQRAKMRMDEERNLVDQALRSKKSPAAIMYNIAKSLGYQKTAQQADPQAAATIVDPAAAAKAPAQQTSVTAEIERIQKAQAASKSLSGAGGAAVGPMTVEQLANMSDQEFEAFARKNPAVVKELMGG